MKKLLIVGLLLSGLVTTTSAQNFKAEQKQQEKLIKATYKKGRLTQLEYEKLMREQAIIKQTISKYSADGILTPAEKNRINDKLIRASKRLRKYKTNREVY